MPPAPVINKLPSRAAETSPVAVPDVSFRVFLVGIDVTFKMAGASKNGSLLT